MSKEKEISLDELDKVTGGLRVNDCPNFMQALNKTYQNECGNCFYYNKNKDDEYVCTNPSSPN